MISMRTALAASILALSVAACGDNSSTAPADAGAYDAGILGPSGALFANLADDGSGPGMRFAVGSEAIFVQTQPARGQATLWGSAGNTALAPLSTDVATRFVATLGQRTFFLDNARQLHTLTTSGVASVLGKVAMNSDPVVVGDRIIFAGNDNMGCSGLVATDGTTSTCAAGINLANGPAAMGSGVLFAMQPTLELSFWDGNAAAPTDLGIDFAQAIGASTSFALVFHTTTMMTAELWRSDGTPAGTTMLTALPNGTPVPFGLVGGQSLIYVIPTLTGFPGPFPLWRSDGTGAGTFALPDLPGPVVAHLVIGDVLFAKVESANGTELWRSDGSAGGTTKLATLSSTGGLVASQDRACFLDRNGSAFQLRCIGANAQTDIYQSPDFAAVDQNADVTSDGTRVVFGAGEIGDLEPQIYVPGDGTRLLADLQPVASSVPEQLTPSTSQVFFTTDTPPALWHSNGVGQPGNLVPIGDPKSTVIRSIGDGRAWVLADGVVRLATAAGAPIVDAFPINTSFIKLASLGDRAIALTDDGRAMIFHGDGPPSLVQSSTSLNSVAIAATHAYACNASGIVVIEDHPSDGVSLAYATATPLPGPQCIGDIIGFHDSALIAGIELLRYGPSDYEILSSLYLYDNGGVDGLDVDGAVAWFTSGGKLYSSIGSAPTTQKVNTRAADQLALLGRLHRDSAGDRMLFVDRAAGEQGWTLWSIELALPPQRLTTLAGKPTCFRAAGDHAWLIDTDGTLWRSDGSAEGTWSAGTFASMDGCDMAEASGVLLYRGQSPDQGRELWAVDFN